jgi:hypothetical protein
MLEALEYMDEITLWRRANQFADDLSAIIIEIK